MNEMRELKEVLPTHIKALTSLQEFIRNNPVVFALYEAILDTQSTFPEVKEINAAQMRTVFSAALVMTFQKLFKEPTEELMVQVAGKDQWYNIAMPYIEDEKLVFPSYDSKLALPISIELSQIKKVRQGGREVTLQG
jgi:hypothetical protein